MTDMGSGASKSTTLGKEQIVVLRPVPRELDSWTSIPSFPKNKSGSDAENDFKSWGFNIWQLQPEELFSLSMAMMQHFNLPQSFNLNSTSWVQFMFQVQRLMGTSENPYHNFYHIMDVAHGCFALLALYGASSLFKDIDIFTILTSAIVHDLEHPGTNNMYQINAGTPLAIRYNDISVLENHHCAKAFELLGSPECNILASFDADQRKYIRKTLIAMVLATDMSAHFSLKAELDSVTKDFLQLADAAADTSEPTKDADASANASSKQLTDTQALTVMKSILHVADISNPAKPWEISRKWSDLVVQEFFAQGDREKAEGLPLSMGCDRDTTMQDELSMNFADFIVAPFFFSVTKLLPKMLPVCKQLEQNRTHWHDLMVERVTGTGSQQETGASAAQMKEVLDKWEGRKATFADKVVELEKACLGR